MITLEYINQLKAIAGGEQNGNGNSLELDLLQALIPALPPMVGDIVSEFLHSQQHHATITIEDGNNVRPDYP